jgi:hypothetical protein
MAGRTMENGLWRLGSRYPEENNDRRFVLAVIRSGFIAAIEAPAGKIFSSHSPATPYFGVKPNVRSKRLT